MILISYDGSADAQAAVDHVAQLMPGAEATVLTVWEPFVDMLARTGSLGMGGGMTGIVNDSADIDAASESAALARATDGAQRATDLGLVATARVEPRAATIATTILEVAAQADADAIAIGTRGLGGVKSFLLGSVSHSVVQHADRAVLVVASPELAGRRHDAIHRAEVPA